MAGHIKYWHGITVTQSQYDATGTVKLASRISTMTKVKPDTVLL